MLSLDKQKILKDKLKNSPKRWEDYNSDMRYYRYLLALVEQRLIADTDFSEPNISEYDI